MGTIFNVFYGLSFIGFLFLSLDITKALPLLPVLRGTDLGLTNVPSAGGTSTCGFRTSKEIADCRLRLKCTDDLGQNLLANDLRISLDGQEKAGKNGPDGIHVRGLSDANFKWESGASLIVSPRDPKKGLRLVEFEVNSKDGTDSLDSMFWRKVWAVLYVVFFPLTAVFTYFGLKEAVGIKRVKANDIKKVITEVRKRGDETETRIMQQLVEEWVIQKAGDPRTAVTWPPAYPDKKQRDAIWFRARGQFQKLLENFDPMKDFRAYLQP